MFPHSITNVSSPTEPSPKPLHIISRSSHNTLKGLAVLVCTFRKIWSLITRTLSVETRKSILAKNCKSVINVNCKNLTIIFIILRHRKNILQNFLKFSQKLNIWILISGAYLVYFKVLLIWKWGSQLRFHIFENRNYELKRKIFIYVRKD